MKATWKESDIRGGRIIGKAGLKWKSIISYDASGEAFTYGIVRLADGHTIAGMTKEALAEWLTNYEYLPKELL